MRSSGRPSTDETGQVYKWYDHDGALSGYVPEHDELAELAWEWVARFTGGETYDGTVPVDPATSEQISQCLTDGEMCQAAAKGIRKYVDESANSKSHHDAMRDSILYLVRLGEQGDHRRSESDQAVRRHSSSSTPRAATKYEVDRAIDGGVAKVLGRADSDPRRTMLWTTQNRDDIQALTDESARRVLELQASTGADPAGGALPRSVSGRCAVRHAGAHLCHGEPAAAVRELPRRRVAEPVRGHSRQVRARQIRRERISPRPSSTPQPASAGAEKFRDSIGIGSGEGLAELYMGWVYDEDHSRAPKKDGTYYKKRVK